MNRLEHESRRPGYLRHSGSVANRRGIRPAADAGAPASELMRSGPDTGTPGAAPVIVGGDLVNLQRLAGNAAVSRLVAQRAPVKTLAPAAETEAQALALVDPALARYQQAVDANDEGLIRSVGKEVAKVWERVELAKLAAPQGAAPAGTNIAPPASPSAATPTAPADESYDRARKAVLGAIPPLRYQGQTVGPPNPQTQYDGALVDFINEHSGQTAWVAKDATEAVKNLRADEPIPEPAAWTVIGLLRQHLNPWHFAYMMAVIGKAGVQDRLGRLPEGPRNAMEELKKTQTALQQIPGMGPTDAVAKIALAPEENVVQLVQPLSPTEAAAELYGKGSNWREVLLPLNRGALAAASDGGWLSAGTRLHVLPENLQPAYRVIFLAAATARQKIAAAGSFSLKADPEGPVVPGNQVAITVLSQNQAFESVAVKWWAVNDPIAVKAGQASKTYDGPNGTLRWGGKSEDTTWKPAAKAVGNHVIHCKLTSKDGKTEELTRTVIVMTPEERLDLKQKANTDFDRSPSELLEDLKKRLATTSDPAAKAEIQKRIDGISGVLSENKEINMRPLRGSYVSKEKQAATVPLRIFADIDRSKPQGESTVHLKLWDFTLSGKPREYTASGTGAPDAFKKVITTFADDAPYPDGLIQVDLPGAALSFPNVPASSVQAKTDGGMLIDDVLRGASLVALGVGVVAGLAGQAEVAVPAFVVSGLLAGAAATFELADRLEHGDFEWDLNTTMNLLDIASALLTFGMASGATAAVRGAGTLRVVGQMNKAVGLVQIGIQAGVHMAAITAAVKSGDTERIVTALGQALAAGALFLIIHKASAKVGGNVDEALNKATGTRTSTGGVDPEGLAKLMNSLPEVPVDQTAMRSFAAESVGLSAEKVTLVPIAGGVQGEGVSGAPVYLIHSSDGQVVGALKIFPKAEEFARELSALQKLGTMELTFGKGVGAKGVARTSSVGGQGGMLVSSAAEGQALNRMMAAAASKSGPARTKAFADLKAAVIANARTLSRLHSSQPAGEVSGSYIQRHVDAALDITGKLEANGAKLSAAGLDPANIRPRVNELVTAFREHPGGSSVVHGDAHPGNFFYDPATGITMIDTPTLHYSLDAAGNPIGSAGRDVANFGQKLANFGRSYGLTPTEIAELQTLFKANYVEAGGGPSTKEADAFFRARTALGELLRTTTETGVTDDALRGQADLARDALGLGAKRAQ